MALIRLARYKTAIRVKIVTLKSHKTNLGYNHYEAKNFDFIVWDLSAFAIFHRSRNKISQFCRILLQKT
jgi:hypothetical protein